MANVMAAENQQFPAINASFDFETEAKKSDLGRVPRSIGTAGNAHYTPLAICVDAI